MLMTVTWSIGLGIHWDRIWISNKMDIVSFGVNILTIVFLFD